MNKKSFTDLLGVKKERKEDSKRVKTINIILSIVLAVILWAYVIGEVNPETEKTLVGVPLTVAGENALAAQGLVVLTDFEDTVTAVIKGRRSEIYGMTAGRLSARIDVSDCVEGENQVTVKVTAPSNVDEAVAKDGHMVVVVDKLVTEEKPVEIAVSGDLRPGSDVEISSLNMETVQVYGPSTYVAEVDHVVGMLKIIEGQQDYSQTISLIPVDDRGKAVKDIEILTPEVNVEATKTLMKEIDVAIPYTGTPAQGIELDLPETVSVNIKGKYDNISGITELSAEPVDISGITQDTAVNVKVRIPSGAAAVDGFGEPLENSSGSVAIVTIEIKVKTEAAEGEV
ncbi:MAG: hypothetical protein E7228_00370 [Clostridiales bacterium]|nr:hypothetical protein [Clostridiales bacterium]